MKLLIVSHTGNYPVDVGGPQAIAHYLSLHLARLGAQVTLYQRFTSNASREKWSSTPEAKQLWEAGVETLPFYADYSMKNIWRYPSYIRSSPGKLDGKHYDVVHYNSPPVDANILLPRRYASQGVAQSVAIHGGLFYESRNTLGRRIFRYQAKYMSGAVVFNGFSKRIALEQGFSEAKIRVIPNGVDVEMVEAVEPKPLEGEPSVVYAGRLEPVKGVGTLLEAALTLGANLKGFRLYVAGSGSLEGLVREYAAKHPGIITYLGRLPTVRDVISLVKGAQFAVIPSLKENFSVSLLEAMASGTPLIVSDAEGNTEVAGVEEAHFFRRGSPESLSQTLERAYTDYEESRRRAERARLSANEKYAWPRVAAGYRDYFANLQDHVGEY